MLTIPPEYAHIFTALERVKGTGDGSWEASCPAHDDRHPSLTLRIGRKGNLLMRCHRGDGHGCDITEIVSALGCTLEDLWPDNRHYTGRAWKPAHPSDQRPEKVYDYRDENNTLLFQVCRFRNADGSKTFKQRQPLSGGRFVWNLNGVRRVIYRLPEVLRAVAADPQRRVAVVEGEKAVDALWTIDVPATCNSGGAGKFALSDYLGLKDCNVAVCPDYDPRDERTKTYVGQDHAEEVCRLLYPIAAGVRYVDLPGLPLKGDAYDWVKAHRLKNYHDWHIREIFWSTVSKGRVWVPPDQPHPLFARAQEMARGKRYVSRAEWLRAVVNAADILARNGANTEARAAKYAQELAAVLLTGVESFCKLRLDPKARPDGPAGEGSVDGGGAGRVA